MLFKKIYFSLFFQIFLVSIYPSLFLWSKNPSETYFSEALFSILVSLVIALLFFIVFLNVFKNIFKATFVTSISVFLFLELHCIINIFQISSKFFGLNILKYRFILPFFLICVIIFYFKCWRSKRDFKFLSICLIFPFLFLNGFAITKIVFVKVISMQEINRWKKFDKDLVIDKCENKKNHSKSLPNVYFIILDKYCSNKVLNNYCDFNNNDFLNDLRKKGFLALESSYSNYPSTAFSISATLNMEYHGDKNETEFYYIFRLMNNNVVKIFLKQGYKYLHIPSNLTHTCESPFFKESDFFLIDFLKKFKKRIFSDFSYSEMFFDGTALFVLKQVFGQSFLRANKARSVIFDQFDKLKNTVNLSDEPYFIFCHILCPHPPFLFDEIGKMPIDPYSENLEESRKSYVGQIKFLNKKILEVLDFILKNSKTKPIIILQADHGGPPGCIYPQKRKDRFEYAFGILNCWYLPDFKRNLLPQDISPVNNFRFIFDKYLGCDFGLLKNHSFRVKHCQNLKEKFINVDSWKDSFNDSDWMN